MAAKGTLMWALLIVALASATPAFAFGGGGGRTRGTTAEHLNTSSQDIVLTDNSNGGPGGPNGTGGSGGPNGTGGDNPLAPTPEPATLLLISSGLIGAGAWARRRRK
jgi:PEP-CTERM motif